MKRINVVGTSGSGKTTFAKELSKKLGKPYIEMDRIFWGPNWYLPPDEEFFAKLEAALKSEEWILDGNYGRTMGTRLARADTIVFLDFPRWRCIGRVLRRWWRFRDRSRSDLAPGCPERLDAGFLLWLWRFPRRSRPKIVELIERHRPGRRIEILRSPRDVRRFLRAVNSRLR